jgi:hypothetical protein
MLIGMDFCYVAASVSMGQIQKGIVTAAGASWEGVRDCAFIKIDGAGVQVSRSAIGDSGQSKIECALRSSAAAAQCVAAIRNPGIIDLRPRGAPVERLPDALIAVVRIDEPGVHFAMA